MYLVTAPSSRQTCRRAVLRQRLLRIGVPVAIAGLGVTGSVSTAAPANAAPASAAPAAPPGSVRPLSTAQPARSTRSITAKPSSTIARVGSRIRVRGTVSGSARPKRVWLQQRHGRAWRTVASARVKRSHFTLRAPTESAGRFVFRVTGERRGGDRSARSRPFSISLGRGNPASVGYLTKPPARWNPCAPIRYRVNLAGAPKSAAADIDRSVERLSAASGLRFRKVGSTKVVPGSEGRDVLDTYESNTDLVVAFVAPGRGRGHSAYLPKRSQTVGVGGAFYTNATTRVHGRSWHRIVQGYVVLDRTKRLPSGFGPGDRSGLLGTWGQVMMHELGHAVGLDHPRLRDPAQIMYAAMTTKPAVWGAGDLTGLQRLGAASGCLTSGSNARPRAQADFGQPGLTPLARRH